MPMPLPASSLVRAPRSAVPASRTPFRWQTRGRRGRGLSHVGSRIGIPARDRPSPLAPDGSDGTADGCSVASTGRARTLRAIAGFHLSTGACVHHHQLERAEAEEVIWCIRKGVPGAMLGLETSAGWFTDAALFEEARQRLVTAGLPLPDGVGPVESFLEHGAIKVFARQPEHDPAAMAASVRDLDVYATWSGPALLEVMHARVNKADALERLARDRSIAREDVAAFGDNHNDVQMLAWAGHGVATANASTEAREAADEIAAHHDEDGVATVLERWFG